MTTVTVPAAGGTTELAATANGQVVTLGFASGAPAVSISASSSVTAPAGAPVPSSIKRAAASISGAVPFYFVSFSVSGSLAAQYLTSEAIEITNAQPASAAYYVEFDDTTTSPAVKLASFGPATIANAVATVTSTAIAGSTTTFLPGHTYLMQFYYVAAPVATPTPSTPPSTSPSAAPTSSPSVTPSSAPTTAPSPVSTSTAPADAVSTTALIDSGGTLTLPSFESYTGTIGYTAFGSFSSLPVTVSFANYLTATGANGPLTGLPTGTSSVPISYYAVINIQASPSGTQSPGFVPQAEEPTITIYAPTLVGVGTAAVRYWEWQPGGSATPLCASTIGGTVEFLPVTNGSITLPSPLAPWANHCTNPGPGLEAGITSFFPGDNALIEISNE